MASLVPLGRRRPAASWPGVVVVGGGKGGVGTSTASALLAMASARLGVSTLLVEAVHGVSVLPLLFDREPPPRGLLSRDGPDVRELQLPLAPGLTLLPGGGSADELARAGQGERAARVRRATALYDGFGMTVVDAGAHLDAVLGALGLGAERLVVVSSPSRISLASGYALLKAALLRHGTERLELLLNGCGEAAGREAFQVAGEAGRRFLDHGLAHAGTLPADPALADLAGEGGGLQRLLDGSPALAAAAAVVARWHAEQRRAREGDVPVIPLAGSG